MKGVNMSNLFDYLIWRGDLSFGQAPLCDADHLVFCRLAFIPWEKVVPEYYDAPSVSLRDAAARVLLWAGETGDGRTFRRKEDKDLLWSLLSAPRYRDLRLTGYVNRVDPGLEKQFSAVTLLLPDSTNYLTFRGTDNSLIGWKENLNMCYASTVPAQTEALFYLLESSSRLSGMLRLAGHSKGGNLAVYAAAHAPKEIQDRILCVFNADGPGFTSDVLGSEGFRRIAGRLRTCLPQSSVVGLLLEHDEAFSVVHSTASGLLQHNLYTWEIEKDSLVPFPGLTEESLVMDRTLKQWVARMTAGDREKFIDGLYSLLTATGVRTLSELFSAKNALTVLRAFRAMDEETRSVILKGLHVLRASTHKTFPDFLDRFTRT